MSSPQAVSRVFDLSSDAVLPNTASTLELGAETAGDVLEAVLNDKPFPNREIKMGSVSLKTATAEPITLGVLDGKAEVSASFEAGSGIAVVDSAAAVVETLGLTSDNPVPIADALAAGDIPDARFVVFRAGYQAQGQIEGSHPVGAFGSVGFGAAGESARLYGVIHRIAPTAGARTSIVETISGIRLPRQVRQASDIPPGSMLIVEANASLAFNLTATLGYDFSFVRDLGPTLGLRGDVGLKLETGLETALGIHASGRFLVAVDRASSDRSRSTLRLRLFKMRQKGWDFGLNLAVGVTPEAPLPEKADDFVKAVFGVYGQQVVQELRRLDEWTDPTKDLSDLVAGLGAAQGLELLERTTGIDPRERFEAARDRVIAALDLWLNLPETASAATWRLLDTIAGDEPARQRVVDTLRALLGGGESAPRDALLAVMAGTGFESSPVGQFLASLADRGLPALLDRADLPDTIESVLEIVQGDGLSEVVRRLHDYVENALDIEQLRSRISSVDFDQINGWLVGRLSDLLEQPLDSTNVEAVRTLINRVVSMRQTLYDRARQAVNRRYDFSLAALWQKSTTREVLLDVEFDMASPMATELFTSAVAKAHYDRLLTTPDPAVRLHSATLSHQIDRKSSVEVHMPFLDSTKTTLNTALASLNVEDDGERVLVYSLDKADDETTEINRLRSSLAVDALARVALSGVRRQSVQSSTWTYSYRFAQRDMRSGEVIETLRPLVDQYFPDHFPDNPDGSLEKWVADLDRAVEDATGNGTTEFGDVLLSLDLRVAGGVLAPWMMARKRPDAEAAARLVSSSLQRTLKDLLPSYYFQDPKTLVDNTPASALIVWAALPPMNEFRVVSGRVEERGDSGGVHWNWPDLKSRQAMVSDPRTLASIQAALRRIEDRLTRSGRTGQARRFRQEKIQDFVNDSGILGVQAGPQIQSLFFSESTLVEEARKALLDVSAFWDDSRTAPSRAVERLAEFGARITKTFNSRLTALYGGTFLRPLGSSMFLEAARALDPALGSLQPDALLVMKVLKEGGTYDVGAFLENTAPDPAEVVLEQRIASSTA